MDATDTHAEVPPRTLFRCRKCRRLVATLGDVVEHSPGAAGASFAGKKRGSNDAVGGLKAAPVCSSIFVEPKGWISSASEGLVEGKLFCENCQARLGNFNWAGMQCSCGSWVNPAFQLHKSRVDPAWV